MYSTSFGWFDWLIFVMFMYALEAVLVWSGAITLWSFGRELDEVKVGWGPCCFRFTCHGASCRFSLFPGGGRLKGQDLWDFPPDTAVYEPRRYLPPLPPQYKVLFSSMAPVVSVLLGMGVLVLSAWHGRVEPAFVREAPRVGWIRPDSSLANAGLMHGDTIVSVGLRGMTLPVRNWREFLDILPRATGENLKLECQRGSATHVIEARLDSPPLFDICHEISPVVGFCKPSSLATKAGFQKDDVILDVGGHPIQHWLEVEAAMAAALQSVEAGERNSNSVAIEIRRKGVRESLQVERQFVGKRMTAFGWRPAKPAIKRRDGRFSEAVATGISDAVELAQVGVNMVLMRHEYSRAYLRPLPQNNEYRSLRGHRYAASSSYLVVSFALYSLCTGLASLLPMPGLPGFSILAACLEKIRRRPVPEHFRNRIDRIATLISIWLLWCLYNYVRWWFLSR